MDADRYQRLKRILFGASQRSAKERSAYLEQECGDDATLRHEVEELLGGDVVATEQLQKPVENAVLGTFELQDPPWDCGPYRIEREVGRGGMGIVYEARDGRSDARVAVKFIPPLFAGAPSINERFAREAEMGRKVIHENVVRTLDVGRMEHRGAPLSYLVMEFVEGESLRELLGDLHTVPESLLRRIAIQVSEGLAAIHAMGIVHRDLKPENVMVTPDRRIRITDLGVAKMRDASVELTGAGQFVGSLPYASPEQCQAEPVGPRADLYSLGVVLYELATGSNPFRHETPAAAIHAHLELTPEPAQDHTPELSAFFNELLTTLLAKHPADRFQSATELARVLTDGEAGEWWLQRERSATAATRPTVGVRRATAIHGREEELEFLRRTWADARAGQGAIVLIEGEAGVGKSRLVDELLAAADPADAHLLYGSYLPGGALLGFCDAVLGRYGGERLEAALRPYFREAPALLGPFAAMMRREAVEDPQATVHGDTLTAASGVLLRSLAAERPTLWAFDDLHDAPDSALRHFEAMARIAAQAPVMLVATTRPGLPDAFKQQLARTGRFLPLSLEALAPRAVEAIVRESTGDPVRAEALGARIAEKSGGNPHFIFAILSALRAAGVLDRPDAPHAIEIPSEIRELVAARIADVSRESRVVLDAAAVQGVLFDADRIAEVVGQPIVGVLQELAELERQRGIVRPAGRLYRFGHNLLQDVVYAALPERLRAEYHTRFADSAAANLTGEAEGSDAEFLAHHHLRGVDPERALPHLDAALDHLETAYRHESALDLIDRALALESLQGRDRLRLILRRSVRLDYLNRREEQREAVQNARQLSEVLGDPALRARTWLALGSWLQVVGREPEGLEAYERAAELAALGGDRGLEADIVARIGGTLARLRRSEEALVHHERFMQLALDLNDRRAQQRAATNRANTLRHLSRYEEASAAYEQAIELAKETGNRVAEVNARSSLGVLRTNQGRWKEAESHLRNQIEFAKQTADRRLDAQGTGNLAISLRLEGRLAEARELLTRYQSICREVGNRRALAVAAGAMAHLEFQVGHLEVARELAEEGRRRAIETHAPQLLASNDDLMGKISYAEGLHAEAMAHFHTAVESYRAIGDVDMLAESLIDVGTLEAELGTREDAVRVLDEAVQAAETLPVTSRLCRALAHRAQVTGADADAERARGLLETDGDTFALYDRIDAAWALFVATSEPAFRERARADLERMRQWAATDDQPGLRARLPLYRAVSSTG